MDTLTLALARELGPRGIRVNSTLPGHTHTPGTQGHFAGELGEKLIAGTPLGRFGEPEDIAPAVVILASDDAHWVTGESIRVAGVCEAWVISPPYKKWSSLRILPITK